MIKVLTFFKDRWCVFCEISPDNEFILYYTANFVCIYPEPEKMGA